MFAKATELKSDGRGLFRGEMPDGWQQGRGAFGGVVIGALVRGIVAFEPNRALRSLTADLCAPVLPGPFEVQVASLRHGTNISFVEGRLLQNGALMARASAALAIGRAVARPAILPSAPTRPAFRAVDPVPIGPPVGPVFARHYEYRSTGPLPFAGGHEAAAEGWIREKEGGVFDEASIAGLLDSWWPTTLALESAPRAVATIQFTMELFSDPKELPRGEPLYYRARGVAGGDDYFLEMRELWCNDQPVAMNQQTFVLLT